MTDSDNKGKVWRYKGMVIRQFVRDNPAVIFVFGDNAIRRGLGGQAKEMRGEPNTVGVPTKWNPSRVEDAYFDDRDELGVARARVLIQQAFAVIESFLATGHDVVIPAAGLGTGLAELPTRAPSLHRFIIDRTAELERIYGVRP